MPEFSFDPPLTLKGNIVVRNLDDAARFMIGYQEVRRCAPLSLRKVAAPSPSAVLLRRPAGPLEA
jgi:hypothetical protein